MKNGHKPKRPTKAQLWALDSALFNRWLAHGGDSAVDKSWPALVRLAWKLGARP